MSDSDGSEPFRCFCAGEPILGVAKMQAGRPVFHIKIWKQRRLFAEILLDQGSMRFKCRNCFRWHRVTIAPNKPKPDFEVENA